MDPKTCFIIAPIGEANSETRERSDLVFEFIITPVMKSCGYADPIRADHLSESGIITNQVIQHLLKDDLVVADLTEYNPNVFYELAVRHTVRKPVVQMMRKDDPIPFDVSGMRTVYYDIHDLRSVDQTKKDLIGYIQNVEKTPENADSPISAVLNFEVLKSSNSPEARSIADLLSEIAEIKSLLLDVKTRVSPIGSRFTSTPTSSYPPSTPTSVSYPHPTSAPVTYAPGPAANTSPDKLEVIE